MLHFLTGNQLAKLPSLESSMFLDRTEQFQQRRKKDVQVTAESYERDEYDHARTLYILGSDENGRHTGSMRFLPLNGKTMLNDHFHQLSKASNFQKDHVWECTRFCLRDGTDRRTAILLLAAGGKLMSEFGVSSYVGVFDKLMERRYRMLNAAPEVLARQSHLNDEISLGIWFYSPDRYTSLLKKCRMSAQEMDLYFVNSGLWNSRVQQVG